jgi:iron(III) transport system ATP-binding protein
VAFPLTVAKNRRYSRAEIEQAVAKALAVVDLDGFQQRPAPRLSGGQQQRVALARAVVHEPRLLLLDEPLSNLDAQLRDEMRAELKQLQTKIGITTVYVTHDQSEALRIRCLAPAAIDDAASVSVSIRPESIRLVPRGGGSFTSDDNCIPGRVQGVTFLGATRRVDVMSDGFTFQVTTAADLPLPADGEVDLLFAPERAVALPGKVS